MARPSTAMDSNAGNPRRIKDSSIAKYCERMNVGNNSEVYGGIYIQNIKLGSSVSQLKSERETQPERLTLEPTALSFKA
jgi:hypothetical protein